MYARLSYSKESRTISFAASELKHYLLKVNNTINFTNDTTAVSCSNITLGLFSDTHSLSDTEDAYRIEISNLNGYIQGSNPRSAPLPRAVHPVQSSAVHRH